MVIGTQKLKTFPSIGNYEHRITKIEAIVTRANEQFITFQNMFVLFDLKYKKHNYCRCPSPRASLASLVTRIHFQEQLQAV